MLSVRVAGVWLRSIGPHSPVAYSHVWPHGSELASWTMVPGTKHPALSARALVEVFDGGIRVWRGFLNEPGTSGEFTASGDYLRLSGILALDGAGTSASNTPDTAFDSAATRGAFTEAGVVRLTRPASLSTASWGTASEPMDLLQLIDEALAGLGLRWYVDADGAVRTASDPTTPKYYVPQAAAGYGLALADDAYFSHLVGYYVSALDVNGNDVISVRPPIGATTRWGRKEGVVDLTAMRVISAATADTQVTNRLALVGPRMGFAESLNLGYGQLTTPGGTPVALTMPRAGEMVRLVGVADQTWPTGDKPYTDIVIGRSSYREGDATVQLDPVNLALRDFASIMKVAVAA